MRLVDNEWKEIGSYDPERGVLNVEEIAITNQDGTVTFEEAYVFTPNPGNLTHAEIEATAPMSDADALKLLLEPQINDLGLDDATALRLTRFHPAWEPSRAYRTGDRVMFGDLYRCLQDHVSQGAWEPDSAPSLWARVLPGQQGEIGEWVQPDSTNPYMKGDHVTHNGETWVSEVDGNVWEPGVYGWNLA